MAQYRSQWTGEVIDDAVGKAKNIEYVTAGVDAQGAFEKAEAAYGIAPIYAKYVTIENYSEIACRCVEKETPGGQIVYRFEGIDSQQKQWRWTLTKSEYSIADEGGYHSETRYAWNGPFTTQMEGREATSKTVALYENSQAATQNIAKEQYVIWYSRLYTADSDITIGTTLRSAGANKNLTAVSNGGLNDLKSAIDSSIIRPNLLRNWYFVGGGSQQGDGIFPINQRGALTFSTENAMTIDQWQLTSGVASLASDGLIVGSGSSGTQSIITELIPLKPLLGKTVTYTVMYDSNGTIGLDTGSVTLPATTPSANVSLLFLVNIPGTYRTRLAHYVAYSGKMFVQIGQSANSSIKIIAAKLELGEGQTLAHNEGTDASPVWALNELPDYATELLRCQTRYQLFRTQSLRPTYRQDFRPVMDTSSGADPDIPNTGTITIGGVTYYYASSD